MDPVVLRPRDNAQPSRPAFVDATFLPSAGLRLSNARGALPGLGTVDLLDDSMSFGGAFLLPYANRVRGSLQSDGRTIATTVLGHRVHLPVNWRGQQPEAEPCAMHGLMYNTPMHVAERGADYVVAALDAGDFGWHPYFSIPSGDRHNARLHIPARA